MKTKHPYLQATIIVILIVCLQYFVNGISLLIVFGAFFYLCYSIWKQDKANTKTHKETQNIPEFVAILNAKNQSELPEVTIEIKPYQPKIHQQKIIFIYMFCLWLVLSQALGTPTLTFKFNQSSSGFIYYLISGIALAVHWYRQDKKNAHLANKPRFMVFNKDYFCYDDGVTQHKVSWQNFDQIHYGNSGYTLDINSKDKQTLSLAHADFPTIDTSYLYEVINHYYYIITKNRPQLKIQ